MSDLEALFRDPDGVTELRTVAHGQGDTTLAPSVFLGRARAGESPPAPAPGNINARWRWVALTAMAGPWLGAVRTWHETHGSARPDAVTDEAEQELFWRLAGGWPVGSVDIRAHLDAWPVPGAPPAAVAGYAATLCDDESFRHTFDTVSARVAEIGERIGRAALVLRMTLAGAIELAPEDRTGTAALAGVRAEATGDDPVRVAAIGELGRLRLDGAPLTPIRASTPDDGERICAYLRGEDVLVAVAVGDRSTGAGGWALPDAATGSWRDLLTGAVHTLPDRATLAGILGPDGRAVLVRQ